VLLSVTVTVNANGVELTLVGVPVSEPSAPSVRPGGTAPCVTPKVIGQKPPVSPNWK